MELAAVINGRIVSITQPSLSSGFLSLWVPTVFIFSPPNCLDPFEELVEGFVFKSALWPTASHVSWSESVLGELADHYDGAEASGGTGAHACRARCHPQIRPQGW